MKTLALNNGTNIPVIGLGLWQVDTEAKCIRAIEYALALGYTHFDTAQFYQNEVFVGKAIRDIDRSKLFITTKIANGNQAEEKLLGSFETSLRDLRTDYVDLLLLHFPVTETRSQAWKQLEGIAKSGRAKAIGVSNYTIRHLEALLKECTIRPAVNQVELHVYLQQPELVAFCREQGIVVEAYSPLAHGHDIDNPVLQEIGRKYNKSAAQVMLRWCLEVGTVPLPKSTHEQRIKENIDIFDFSLDQEDMTKLQTLDRKFRTAWDPTQVA